MKELFDGSEVPARMYYYILDLNDCDNFKSLYEMFDKKRLYDLTRDEFVQLFNHATKVDFTNTARQLFRTFVP